VPKEHGGIAGAPRGGPDLNSRRTTMNRFSCAFFSLALAAALSGCASAPPMQEATLRVNVFPGSTNLPLLAAIDKGFFAQRKLTIVIQNTPNSDEQRAGLAAGKFEIAHAGVDNAVAMIEAAKEDVIIVSGGDASMNEFMVRPEINSIADIRGKALAVDAPNTAYALVAKKILKNNGLLENRDYSVRPVGGTGPRSAAMASNPQLVAGMVNPPFAIAIREKGLKSLGTQFSFIGPYQATGAFVMRKWADSNSALLVHYLAAYIEGQRYAMDPANRTEMIQLLTRSFKLSPAVAEGTYLALMTPGSGLAPDARLNMDGFKAVLAIRAEIEGMWGGKPPSPEKFLDLSYYDRAASIAR
jgi:ABC-type nitrate/sulfonate/bicarbonate transport system substrate-binding protein